MLTTMRHKTTMKIIMGVLLFAFVGWLVFEVGMGVTGRNSGPSDIGSVNGTPIRYQTYIDTYRAVYEQARQQNPGMNFSREEVREIENEAFNQLVQAVLLRDEYNRRGIFVTNREIVDAVRQLPPPEITQAPDFQTNGQFDPAKYERFLSSSNANTRQYLLAMEQRYREELPRYKLLQEVTQDVYVSDAKLWSIYRDIHDSVTVRVLLSRGENAPDSMRMVTDEEVRRYFDAHKDEFRRPSRALMSYIAVTKTPTPVDSIALLGRVRSLRDSIVRGAADFAEVARTESSDTASGSQGGSLGTFAKGTMDPVFERAALALPIGQVSEPVFTQFGIHLIKVEKKTADSITARHILFPYARIGARLDTLEARADSLDRQAADQSDPAVLDSVARLMNLRVERAPLLYQGTPFILGRYRIPDVSVWAFEARPGETSPVVETNGFYYVFRVDSLWEAGTPPLSEVAQEVRVKVMRDKRRASAEAVAREAERRLSAGQSMDQVARDLGMQSTTLTFSRTTSVPVLGTATAAVGSAFRLRIGERSPLLSNEEAFFFLQPERRTRPDSAAWAAQKEQQRAQIIRTARQLRVQLYMASLRRAADVKDRREEVFRPANRDQQAQQAGTL